MKEMFMDLWRHRYAFVACVGTLLLAACENADLLTNEDVTTNNNDPVVVGPNPDQSATVGVPFSYDATRGGQVFEDSDGDPLTYGVKFSPGGIGLVANAPTISGTPASNGTVVVTITAEDGRGGIATDEFSITISRSSAPVLVNANSDQGTVVGDFYNYDATLGGTAFSDADGQNLTYTVQFSPQSNGFTATGGVISGRPTSPAVTSVVITATDESENTASDAFHIVAFGTTAVPNLPVTPFVYADGSINLPAHFRNGGVANADNTPNNNRTTNAGATLGRVLFYDTRLSGNDTEACASCHKQGNSFADPGKRFSVGFEGGLTGRNSPSLANARYYERGNAFWDERASSFEEQALMPIQDEIEMGLPLDDLEIKLRVTDFYPPLFQAAFGTPEITRDRVARAIAQFVRSMVSYQSKFDQAFTNGTPDFASVFTAQEQQGEQIFDNRGCDRCHSTNAHISDTIHNTGLDAATTDEGAGNARFKAPSLRNIAVSAPYMHDGRFATLEEVIEFYNSGVQNHPNLDNRMETNGSPDRLNLTQAEKDALVAFLQTLTDNTFLTDPKFSDPFDN